MLACLMLFDGYEQGKLLAYLNMQSAIRRGGGGGGGYYHVAISLCASVCLCVSISLFLHASVSVHILKPTFMSLISVVPWTGSFGYHGSHFHVSYLCCSQDWVILTITVATFMSLVSVPRTGSF